MCFFAGSWKFFERMFKYLYGRVCFTIQIFSRSVVAVFQSEKLIHFKYYSLLVLIPFYTPFNLLLEKIRIDMSVVDVWADQVGWRTLCIKTGYGKPTPTENQEGSSTLTDRSRVFLDDVVLDFDWLTKFSVFRSRFWLLSTTFWFSAKSVRSYEWR